jgi:hypothetical protein
MTPGVDTYITAAEADEIISGLMLSTDARRVAWNALSTGDKEVYLRHALMWIDGMPLQGRKRDTGQPLQFPRHTHDTVPAAVKQAQALEAAASIGMIEQMAKRAQLRAQGIMSFSAGKLHETYGAVSAYGLFSPQAERLLRPYMLGGVPFA